MTEFPKMLYKFPGSEPMHGGNFATKIVQDQDEQDEAQADGWKLTTTEAKAQHDAPPKKPEKAPVPIPELVPETVTEEVKAEAALADSDAADAEEPTAADDEAYKAEREQLKADAVGLGLVFARNATNEKLRNLISAARGQV